MLATSLFRTGLFGSSLVYFYGGNLNHLHRAGKADITGPAADVNLMVGQIIGLTQMQIAPTCLYAATSSPKSVLIHYNIVEELAWQP